MIDKDQNQAPEDNNRDLSNDVDIIPEEILEGLPEEKRKEIIVLAAEHFFLAPCHILKF